MQELRLARGFPVGRLAREIGVSRQSVYSLLNGLTDARVGTLESVARVLDVPWERVVAAFRQTRANRAALSP